MDFVISPPVNIHYRKGKASAIVEGYILDKEKKYVIRMAKSLSPKFIDIAKILKDEMDACYLTKKSEVYLRATEIAKEYATA